MEKEYLRSRVLAMGADAVGFGAPRVFQELLPCLEARENLPFEERNPRRRVDPFAHFPGAKGIVCILVRHGLYENELAQGEWKMASSSVRDYHLVIRDILKEAASLLASHNILSAALCDTQGLLDKRVAAEAGLGFQGKNSLLIHPELGSSTHIGYLLTSAAWEPDPMIPAGCGSCRACADACPVSAIDGEAGGLDHLRCLAGVTQNRRASPRYLEGFLYGCDICQRACPYNRVEKRDERLICRKDDFALSNREFQRKYAQTEFAWIGRKLLLRNMQWNEEEE